MMGKVERKKCRKKDEREIISSNFCELVFLLFFNYFFLISTFYYFFQNVKKEIVSRSNE